MTKYLVCLITCLVIGMGTLFADVEHTVVRGESIESIANNYKISKEALIKANPGIDSLFYVGMKIRIPSDERTSTSAYNEVSSANESIITNVNNGNKKQKDFNNSGQESEDLPTPGVEMAFKLSYGFIPKPEGSSQSPWAFAAVIGANYWFVDKLSGPFAGAMIGYDSSSFLTSSISSETKSSCHFVSVPINIGYALTIVNNKFALTPYVGLSPKFCVKATGESKMYGESIKYDIKKKFSLDLSYGVALRIMGLNIIGAFSTPLNDAQKGYFGDETYFNIGIGFGL